MNELRYGFAFFMAALILIAAMVLPLPWNDVSYLVDSSLDKPYKQYFYHMCGFAMLWYLWFKTKKIPGFLDVIACLLFGPLVPLIWIFYLISYKIVPRKANG